jgi:hypothetical protein
MVALAIVVLADTIVSVANRGVYETASAPTNEAIVAVRFIAQVTAEDITAFLETYNGNIIDVPRPGGFYRVRIAGPTLSQEELKKVAARMAQEVVEMTLSHSEGGKRYQTQRNTAAQSRRRASDGRERIEAAEALKAAGWHVAAPYRPCHANSAIQHGRAQCETITRSHAPFGDTSPAPAIRLVAQRASLVAPAR